MLARAINYFWRLAIIIVPAFGKLNVLSSTSILVNARHILISINAIVRFLRYEMRFGVRKTGIWLANYSLAALRHMSRYKANQSARRTG